jgi:hypothetical protein
MQFVEAILKRGKTIIGYVINTYGSQIQMLSLEGEKLVFISFSKSALEEIKELRPLNKKEVELLEEYMKESKEITECDFQVRKLQSHIDFLRNERDGVAQELFKEALLADKKETAVLSVEDMDSMLTETGYKNLFLTQRYGLIVLGEHEEVIFLNQQRKMIPLLVKQAKEVANLLNKHGLTKEIATTFLSQYATEAKSEKVSECVEKEGKKEETKTENQRSKKSLNITDIQDKLNEGGFQTLRKLQESRLIKIHDDGTIDFGEIGSIPMFKDMLNNPKLLVDILNQPIPNIPSPMMIPFPLVKGVEGLLKQLERQFNPNSDKEK